MRMVRNRFAVAALAVVLGMGLFTGIGAAVTADAGAAAIPQGCSDAGGGVLSCTVPSEKMQSTVTVNVRPGVPAAGGPGKAVYLIGGTEGSQATMIASQYGPEYTLVSVQYAEPAWTTDWQQLPRGNDGGTFWNQTGGAYNPQWDTFIGTELPAYLATEFDVAPTGNAIVGLSDAGAQAITIALDHPSVFAVANSISGFYQTDSTFGHLLIPTMLALKYGVFNGFTDMWGNPFDPNSRWAAHDPSKRIREAKANGQTIIVSTGTTLNPISFLSTLLLNATVAVLDLPVRFVYGSSDDAALVQEALEKTQGALSAVSRGRVSKLSVDLSESAAPTVLSASPSLPSAPSTTATPIPGSGSPTLTITDPDAARTVESAGATNGSPVPDADDTPAGAGGTAEGDGSAGSGSGSADGDSTATPAATDSAGTSSPDTGASDKGAPGNDAGTAGTGTTGAGAEGTS